MPKAWAGPWKGGRWFWRGRRQVFVLQRMRGGKNYTLTLDVKNEPDAEAELVAFDANPEAYAERLLGEREPATQNPLYLSTATIQPLLDDQRARGQAKDHVYATKLYLAAWSKALEGRDLHTVTTAECGALLDAWKTARKLRITALKTFCTWYSDPERGRLDPAKNPAAKLKIKKSLAAKFTKPRHYEIAEVEAAYAATDSQVQRDIMRLSATTGAHTTELERFAEGIGYVSDVPKKIGQGIAGVIWILHKNGEKHPNSVDAGSGAAAKRIRERGGIPSKVKRNEYCHRLARREGYTRPILYGALRHSFITWARSRGGKLIKPKGYGLSLEEVAQAVGHKSTKTTAQYDGTEIPPMIWAPIKFKHKDDPPLP